MQLMDSLQKNTISEAEIMATVHHHHGNIISWAFNLQIFICIYHHHNALCYASLSLSCISMIVVASPWLLAAGFSDQLNAVQTKTS